MQSKTIFTRIGWTVALLILTINFIAVVIALTDIFPGNPLKEYQLTLGIAFMTIGGFVREAYKRHKSRKKASSGL